MSKKKEQMRVMRRLLEEVWSDGNLSLLPELLHEDYVGHGTPHDMTLRGVSQYEQRVAVYKSLFPEIRFIVEDQFTSGDKVATRWSAHLQEDSEMARRDADSGEPITVSGISISRMQDGKIIEDWDTWDTLTLLESSSSPDVMEAITLSL